MTTKKIRDYINKSVRHLRHRKGFGVHSPFAYSIITDVIEERCSYYAYSRMSKLYTGRAPIPFKVATLFLRLANRFGCRNILELNCNGGYTAVPLVLTDKQNQVLSIATKEKELASRELLKATGERANQVTYLRDIISIDDSYAADMIILSAIPAGFTAESLVEWIMAHAHENTVVFMRGVRSKQQLEYVWDELCEREDVEITMDMYDYGLAIRRPRFFKQHYIVSF